MLYDVRESKHGFNHYEAVTPDGFREISKNDTPERTEYI